jgi:superfamily II DNA or RNA helicase
MSFALRDYQQKSIDDIRASYRSGKRAPLLCAPTGSGKSRTLEYMLGNTKKRTLILAHRTELVDQISSSLSIRHGLIMPGRTQTDDQIMVGMMQTVSRRLDKLPAFEWVISDEAHLAICPTWINTLKHYGNAWHLGMSATPCRLDGRGLGEHYDDIIFGPSIRELTERKYLAPWRAYGSPIVTAKLKMAGSDFSKSDAAKEFGKPAIVGNAVQHFKKYAADRLAVVFCCDREHAEITAAAFNEAGIPSTNVDSVVDDRKARIDAFRAGKIRVLTNVDLLTTGFDMPEIGCLIFLRRTASLSLFIQMLGRAARPFPGKRDYIILDHVGNLAIHGFPDDEREWSLNGAAPKKNKEAEQATRQCPECYAIHKPAPKCPECGTKYRVKSRKVEQVDGELSEIDREHLERMRSEPLNRLLAKAHTRADLQEIAKARGYAPGWVFHQQNIRRSRNIGAGE